MVLIHSNLVFAVLYIGIAIISLNTYVKPNAIHSKKQVTDPRFDLLEFLTTELETATPALTNSTDDISGESAVEESRRRKSKGKRLSRYLYPVMIGLFMTKMIVFPLLLKALTIMSSASFVISKMSLLTSVLLGFKWFLTNHSQPMMAPAARPAETAKVEIVHVPMKKHEVGDWDRETNNKYHVPTGDNYDPYYNELKPTAYV